MGAAFAGTLIFQRPSPSGALELGSMDLKDFYGVSDPSDYGHKI